MSVSKQALEFLTSRKSLCLSTVSKEGELETSVTPFVFYEGRFYIFVSELARHTQNLLHAIDSNSAQKLPISGLLIADEAETEQIFARERMSFKLKVVEIEQDSKQFTAVLSVFEQQFGEVVEVLQGLPDFHLFELTSTEGGYVCGFGQAFAFEGMPADGIHPVRS